MDNNYKSSLYDPQKDFFLVSDLVGLFECSEKIFERQTTLQSNYLSRWQKVRFRFQCSTTTIFVITAKLSGVIQYFYALLRTFFDEVLYLVEWPQKLGKCYTKNGVFPQFCYVHVKRNGVLDLARLFFAIHLTNRFNLFSILFIFTVFITKH